MFAVFFIMAIKDIYFFEQKNKNDDGTAVFQKHKDVFKIVQARQEKP